MLITRLYQKKRKKEMVSNIRNKKRKEKKREREREDPD
jgi:hypothetical protein